MHVELLPPDAQLVVGSAPLPARELLLGYWRELLVTPPGELSERRARELAALRANGTPYHYVAGDEPAPAYLGWLTAQLPGVAVTVLPGSGHFPHLAHPAELAGILARCTPDVGTNGQGPW